MKVSSILSDFALGAVPATPAHQMMALSLYDWAACAIAGIDEPVARILRDVIGEEGGGEKATVVGLQKKCPSRAAALINGATSHALDYDDTHFAHIGHPSVAVIPAALAMAEETGADGEAFLQAALVGVEASIRVGVWLGRDHYQTGFHQTATAGAFGAALAAGRLKGLNAGQMAHALGLVSSRASGLKSQFGTMGKPMNAGIAAANGVEAAKLSGAGMESDPDAVDGPQGFAETHAGAGALSAFDGLGQEWLFEMVSHKFHACCHGLHAMLEALASLQDGLDASAVAKVRIKAPARWATVCNISTPTTGLEAKFSYRQTAAMALAGLDTGAAKNFDDSTVVRDDVVKLRDRVDVGFDDEMSETSAEICVTFADGSERCASHDLLAPMGLDQRCAKLRRKATAMLGEARAENLWLATQGRPDLPALSALLRG